MGRTRLAKATLRELYHKKSSLEKRKKELISYLEKLKHSYKEDKISYSRYVEIIHKKRNGRTIEEWIHYYHHEALACYREIQKHHRKKSKKNYTTFLALSILTIFLISFFGISQIGFVTQGENDSQLVLNEFSHNVSLDFSESTIYEFSIPEKGNLTTLTLTGSIKGNGTVKIYFEEILTLDSSQINKASSRSITALAIENSEAEGKSTQDEEITVQEEATSSEDTEITNSEPEAKEVIEEESSQTEDSSPSQENSSSSQEVTLEDSLEENKSYSDELNESEALTIPQTEDSSPSQEEEEPASSETIKEIIFEKECENTCLIEIPLTKENYELRIEVEKGTTLNLEKIDYKILTEIFPEEETTSRQIEGIRGILATSTLSVYDFTSGTSTGYTNPGNSWDSTDNTYASRDIPKKTNPDSGNYITFTGNTIPSKTDTINTVEIGIEGYGESTDVDVYLVPYFSGTTAGTEYPSSRFQFQAITIKSIYTTTIPTCQGSEIDWNNT